MFFQCLHVSLNHVLMEENVLMLEILSNVNVVLDSKEKLVKTKVCISFSLRKLIYIEFI